MSGRVCPNPCIEYWKKATRLRAGRYLVKRKKWLSQRKQNGIAGVERQLEEIRNLP